MCLRYLCDRLCEYMGVIRGRDRVCINCVASSNRNLHYIDRHSTHYHFQISVGNLATWPGQLRLGEMACTRAPQRAVPLVLLLATRVASLGVQTPPRAARKPSSVVYGVEDGVLKGIHHGALLDPPIVVQDDLFYLSKRSDETLAHIAAESAYLDATLEHSSGWRDARDRCRERLQASGATFDDTEPCWHRLSDWEYAQRVEPTRGPYPIYVRRRANEAEERQSDNEEQLLLDANAVPALVESPYQPGVAFSSTLRGVCVFRPSPGGTLAAYTVDTTGEERFAINVVQLGEAGGIVGSKPILTISGVDVDFVWGGVRGQVCFDSRLPALAALLHLLCCIRLHNAIRVLGRAAQECLHYVTMDETGRPCRVHRCDLTRALQLADPAQAPLLEGREGELLFAEADARFRCVRHVSALARSVYRFVPAPS